MARSWSRLFRHLDYFFTVTILNSSICKGRMWWLKIHCPWIYRKSWQLWSCKHSSNLWWPPSGEKCRAGATTLFPILIQTDMYVLQAFAQYLTFQNLFYFCIHVTNRLFVPCSLLKIRKEFLDLLPTVFDFLRLKLVLSNKVLGMSHRVADRHPSLPKYRVCFLLGFFVLSRPAQHT